MKLVRPGTPDEFDAEVVAREADRARVRIGSEEIAAGFSADGRGGGAIVIGGRRYRIATARRGDSILIGIGPASFEFRPAAAIARRRSRGLAAAEITAPMPGKVLKIMVKEGDRVEAGQPLAAIEAMKMETTLCAESAAIVKRIRVKPGDPIDHGAVLIELAPAQDSPASGSRRRMRG